MRRLLEGQPEIRERIFTETEISYCNARRRAMQHYAARFAAKEAVMKAFGTGLANGVQWTDVEVINAYNGRPHVVLHGAAAALGERRGLRTLEVSLSHTTDLAIAQAVAVFEGRGLPVTGAGRDEEDTCSSI